MEQTLRMLENVEALLGRAGMGWDNVAHMIIYLRDIADHRAVERIFAERFPAASSAPSSGARAGVPSRMAHRNGVHGHCPRHKPRLCTVLTIGAGGPSESASLCGWP